ncbi:hypothetical protein Dsin_006931 [Dipteronia sinensis]|uniref:Uncharacterized protein n=1 Tax=Dipteronia sinensis TaxID=43782 RepID=A0AAE0B0N6_9ROSI|nr:hypothetical protein Dsin_006931 [Dipteronia sinensis]
MWRSLLSACRVYKDTVTAKHATEKVIELKPQEDASYVLLNNNFVDAGIELPALEVRQLMKDEGIKKEPGLSWIEVGNKIYSFVVGDRSHPMSHIICESFDHAKLDHVDNGFKDMLRFQVVFLGVSWVACSLVKVGWYYWGLFGLYSFPFAFVFKGL